MWRGVPLEVVTKQGEAFDQIITYVRDVNGNLLYAEKDINGVKTIDFSGIDADIMTILDDAASTEIYTMAGERDQSYLSSITDVYGNTIHYDDSTGVPDKFVASDGETKRNKKGVKAEVGNDTGDRAAVLGWNDVVVHSEGT